MKYPVFFMLMPVCFPPFWGTESQRGELGETLLQSIGALSSDENGTQVLQKALLHAPQKVGLGHLLALDDGEGSQPDYYQPSLTIINHH